MTQKVDDEAESARFMSNTEVQSIHSEPGPITSRHICSGIEQDRDARGEMQDKEL
jgi:hypothetical protein